MTNEFRVIVDYFEHSLAGGQGIAGELINVYDDKGNLVVKGIVNFIIAAGPGSTIRGTALFNEMMAYFGDAEAIEAVWRKGLIGLPSTNIDKVNELTSQNMPLHEAILHAWTVTRARKLGFAKTKVLGKPEGTAGNYSKIDVWIEK